MIGAGFGGLEAAARRPAPTTPNEPPPAAQQAAEAAAADAQAKADAAVPPWTTELGAADPAAPVETGAATDANAPSVAEAQFDTQPGAAPDYGNVIEYQRDFDTSGLALADDNQTPSQRMGLDARAGALSAAAVQAVDSGAHDQMQQAAALAQAAAIAGDAKPAQKHEQKPRAAPEVDPKTGEIAPDPGMAAWSDADLSTAFRGAQSREVRLGFAKELQRRRAEREQQGLQAELAAEQAGAVPGAERADTTFASLTEDAGAPKASMATTTGAATDGPQAAQAQQAIPQPAQAQARAAAPAEQGLTDGRAPTQDAGAQAAPAAGAQGKAQGGEVEALRQQLRDVEAKILRAAPDALGQGGGDIEAAMKNRKVPVPLKAQRKKLVDQVRAAQAAEVKTFAPETGTLGIPRADMPQVPTQSHGGLVKHLNAQGIAHETTTVDAAALKPTQAEYSPAKVEAAKTAGGDRAVIVSSDGHIIDGHHQAMAAAEEGKQVKAIVLDAPVEQALEAVRASPSAHGRASATPKKPRGILAKKAEAEERARADYFTPGNIVKSYGGHDRVISYTPPDESGRWSVTVRAVQAQDGKLVDVPNERERTHATPPDAKELKAGLVQRAVLAQVSQNIEAQANASGPFGPILTQYRGDAQGAIKALTELQDGEAVAALNHPEVGDIDLVWGEVGTGNKDGFGLSKLLKYHPEVLGDLQGFLGTLKKDPKRSGKNRVRLVSEGGEAAVSLDWKGDRKVWLLTAYEKSAGDGTTMNTADVANRDDTTRPDASAGTSVSPTANAAQPVPKLTTEQRKTSEIDGGNVALFRRDTAEPFDYEAMQQVVLGQPSGFSAAAREQAVSSVRQTVDAIRAAWGPNAPEVVVAFDMRDASVPESARQADLRQRSGGARGAPEGFYYRGKAYLMASRLNTPADAARVLFHEVLGHHGLRGKFGKDLDNILNQIATMRKAEVDAKIKDYGLRGVSNLDRRTAAEEVLAEMAEKNPQLHFVRRAVAAIRNWLREHVPGFKNLRLTDDDIIQAYILPARGWVERGMVNPARLPAQGVVAPAYSRSESTQTDYEARIDALFGGGKAQVGTRVLDRSDVMGLLGYPDVPLMLNESHLRDGLANHPEMTAAAWKKVPEWIENPAMVYRSLDAKHPGRIVMVAPELMAGYPVVMAIEPSPGVVGGKPGQASTEQLLVTVFAKTTGVVPAAVAARQGRLLYLNKQNAQLIGRGGGVQFPKHDDVSTGRTKILTEKHLAGWRRANAQEAQDGGDGAVFSRSRMAELKASALDQIHQTLSHPGKVSLWDKTVGTMRHLAERAPAFKPVFETAQRQIDDVSMLANDAADMAPRLLPRVDSLGDIIGKNRKKAISAEDNKAVARPLFEGTLMWGRGLDGKPVLVDDLQQKYASLGADEKAQLMLRAGRLDDGVLAMWRGLPVAQYEAAINSRFDSKVLKAGVVWEPAELRDMFGLNDLQASLYAEARGAIDRSIDMTARADMMRALGEQYAPMRDAVLEAPNLTDALTLLVETLEQEAQVDPQARERLADLMHGLRQRYDKARELMAEGYAPLSRFGRYTLDVVDANGDRQYFGMYESMADSNRAKIQMASIFPGATISQGTMSVEAFKLFQGVTPESLELFGNMLGLDAEGSQAQDKAFQQYLQLAKNNHSALKRLIHRKGIAGYSEDVGRVLASFIYSNARQAAGGLNAGMLDTAINAIPKEQGELKDVAMGLRAYIQDPQEEGQAIRGMLFAQYLGGSVASAFVNMTQPFAVTLPWLSQFGGMSKAGAQLARALKDMGTRRFQYEAGLADALQAAEDDGVVSPQEIHQLMAQARGAGSLRVGDGTRLGDARAAAANTWERTKVAWGQPFALAEQFNRRSTFIAAYRLAQQQGMERPAEFARRAVLETQFLYSKANKMRWARGAVGGTLMTFKTYSVSYLELMHRMWTQGGPEGKRAVGWAVAMLLLMGGAGGLPFMEDAEDLIDGIGQLMGYNVSAKQWRKQALRDVLGKELGDFMEQGISGLPGAPVDVSGRLGMGNLLPGTGLLMTKHNRERDLLEIAGPAGDLVARGFTGGRKLLTGDVRGAAMEVAPTAVRNAAKGIDMATSGIYKDTKGYKVIDTTLAEAAAKFIGFQPKPVADVQESNSFMQRSKSFYIQTSSEIKAQWAKAVFEKDEAALERVRSRLAAWNENNPEQRIIVKIPDIMKRVREMGKDRTQRIADTAPKALRQQMRELAREAG